LIPLDSSFSQECSCIKQSASTPPSKTFHAHWFIINHNDDQDAYSLAYFLDLKYSDFVLLLKEAKLYGTSNNGNKSIDYDQMVNFIAGLNKDVELIKKRFCYGKEQKRKVYYLLWISEFKDQAFHFHDQVIRECSMKTWHVQ